MIERSNSTPSSSTPARPLGVDEEYDQAFRSKSFLDLWSHAHHHLVSNTLSSFKLSSKPSSVRDQGSSPDTEQSCSYTVLDDFVLEPSPEVLARGTRHQRWRRRRRRGVEALLLEYFDVTQEACEACSALLAAIGAARRHHLTLRRLLLRLDGGDDAEAKDALSRHVCLDNPLSPGSLSEFHEVHARCSPLASRLAAAQRRLRRLARALRIARGTALAALIGACAAAIVAAVVFAAHALVGIGVAAAAASSFGATPSSATARRTAERISGEWHHARACATLDAAARGAYIVGRDLDTVSRMVRRAHDELEHGRDVARIAMRGHGERPLLQEVAREEEECEEELRAQLAELEEHVCLCLITINRTRRLVAHEITKH